MEESRLFEVVERFLQNPFWAEYYDCAPSGAKEVIALEFYLSGAAEHHDSEAHAVLKEVKANLDAEDIAYLAEHSPNHYERAYYRKARSKAKEGWWAMNGKKITASRAQGELRRIFREYDAGRMSKTDYLREARSLETLVESAYDARRISMATFDDFLEEFGVNLQYVTGI